MKNSFVRLTVNVIAIMFTCVALGLLAAGMVLYHYSRDLPDYSDLAHYDPATVTRLYAGDGRLLAEYAVEKRIFVPLNAVPKRVIQAFIAAEDKDFYTNTGIDLRGIIRAGLNNWRSLRGGGHSVAGGSTITQQVVKNFLLTPEKSLSRKIKEAILAYRITKIYSKDRILELYLNEIYLGKGSYGVAAAAINYFNKSLDELTVEEAAMLAALPKEPAHIDPATHYNIAKDRRDYVINRMMEDGYITADEARAGIATPITLRVRDKTETASADFFAEEVRRELAAKYGDDALYKGGLFVKTTLDPVMQQYSDAGLRFALTEYDRRKGYRGPLVHIDVTGDWKKALAGLEDKKRWPLFDGERLAVVLEGGKALLGFADGKRGALDKASMAWAQHKGLAAGDVVIAAPAEKDQYALHQIPEVNGAMIVMDPHTGRVLAMSGGYAYGGTEFNRATQAHRQPGSAFKPFVYLTAMENGFTPATVVVDEPVELPQGAGMPVWRPNNYSEEYLGPATLRMGLEKSRNAMTVRLATMLGLDKIIEVAERFGIYDKLPEQFSLVLGAQETTLIRLANAYSIIDNGGKKVSPWLIERIDDKTGKTIFRRDGRPCTGCKVAAGAASLAPTPPTLPDDRTQIVDARADYQVISMLEGVVLRGTGARAARLGKPLAGKTGTTNDSRDTWFMGFSPDLVAGIYVGYDQPRTLGKKETGASVALPGFINFMEKALADKPSTPFRIPPGINFIRIDEKTGQPPVEGQEQGKVILEAFKDGEGPDTQPAGMPGMPTWQGGAPQYNFPAENPDGTPLPPGQGWQPGAPQPGQLVPGNDEGTGGLY
jgi:penicillin-binding protein 1A